MVDTQLRAVLFHGLADHSRLAILHELEHGERRVGDLVATSGLTQSNVSKHLACLWECGLVERERRGREIHYRLVIGIAELHREFATQAWSVYGAQQAQPVASTGKSAGRRNR